MLNFDQSQVSTSLPTLRRTKAQRKLAGRPHFTTNYYPPIRNMYLQDKGSPDAASLPNDSENPPQYEKVPLMPEVGVVKDVAEFWISDDEDLESNIDPGKVAGKSCLRKAPRWSCLYLAIGTLLPLCFLGLAYNGLAAVLDLVSLLRTSKIWGAVYKY